MGAIMEIPETVLDRLTATQRAGLEAVQKHGSIDGAAEALGRNTRSFRRLINRAKSAMADAGWSPEHDMVKPVAPGYGVKGISTLYTNGERGTQVAAQWVKTDRNTLALQQLLNATIEELQEDIPRVEPVAPPSTTLSDLLNMYMLTDYHLGMLAWGEETGADWDLRIATDLMLRWMRYAVDAAPAAADGYLVFNGDLLHFDGLIAETVTNKNPLDADTRFSKLVRSCVRILRSCIHMLLEKHDRVFVLIGEGNHDEATTRVLSECFAPMYEHEPRVHINLDQAPYYAHRHGDVSLFFHHGHKRGVNDVDRAFASKFREMYGATRYSYAHLGHRHHRDIKESELMIVEQHPTLAAPDAHAARLGLRANRAAHVITYHKTEGEVSRLTITSKMAEACR